MVGPTGCGKTYLTELLFGKILELPVTSIDMTGFTETGYVGRQVSEILYSLQNSANGNKAWAGMGVCILDEFDKLASARSVARFSGGGTTKDVSGYGVQRELLKLIEGGKNPVSSGGPYGPQSNEFIETSCISFVACGAFSGINDLTVKQRPSNFGFKRSNVYHNTGDTESELEQTEIKAIEVLNQYGFMPELLGRFNSIVTLSSLERSVLEVILKQNVLPAYISEFSREGLELEVSAEVLDNIVNNAVSRKTGARGLATELTEYIEDKAFNTFGANYRGKHNKISQCSSVL
jgi:ATP-dependent Clp protease ATP-binding subunit ClpX